jgi:predicted HicB family RNase H-like nuclease
MSSFLHYDGYVGSVEFSEADNVLHGKVIGIKPLISFEGDTVKAITEDFHNAVDEYLDFCRRNGKKPAQSYKGSFNIRITPELHRKAVISAQTKGISLNAFVEEAIRRTLNA